MKIFLVRHGESQANVDQKINKLIPDHEIALSSKGIKQTQDVGDILFNLYKEKYNYVNNSELLQLEKIEKTIENSKFPDLTEFFKTEKGKETLKSLLKIIEEKNNKVIKPPKIRLWHSPYRRTRETANIIKEKLSNIITDSREDVLLCEQQFGLFDGLNDEEQLDRFPEEFKYFNHVKQHNGKFWARYPMGESAFDVSCRLRQFFGTLKRDEENGYNNVIIVCHGTVLRLFTMAWLHYSPEWFASEKGPGNCAIRILNGPKDEGYYHGGYRDGEEWFYEGNKWQK